MVICGHEGDQQASVKVFDLARCPTWVRKLGQSGHWSDRCHQSLLWDGWAKL